MSDRPPLVALGFGKYVRADKVYALQPIEGGERGRGRRTVVWVEGIPEPLVASRSEGAIVRDLGGGRSALAAGLGVDALDLLRELARQSSGVGALLRRQIKAESGLDLDGLESRARELLDRAGDAGGRDQETLFH